MTIRNTASIASQPPFADLLANENSVGGDNADIGSPKSVQALPVLPLRDVADADLPGALARAKEANELELVEFLKAHGKRLTLDELERRQAALKCSLKELLSRLAIKMIFDEIQFRASLVSIVTHVLSHHEVTDYDGETSNVLILTNDEYPEATCPALPPDLMHGQEVAIVGIPTKRRDTPQLAFEAGGLKIVEPTPVSRAALAEQWMSRAPAGTKPRRAFDAIITGIPYRNASWKALRISGAGEHAAIVSASGYIGFPIGEGDRVRLWGFLGDYNGKPALIVHHAEPLSVAYDDGELRVFVDAGGTKDHFNRLFALYGSEFPATVLNNPGALKEALPRARDVTHAKTLAACAALLKHSAFSKTLRSCGVAGLTVVNLVAKFPQGVTGRSPYAMVNCAPLNPSSPRGPKKGLTPLEADKLAQSPYALATRPYDRDSLARATAYAHGYVEDRCEMRGDCGAPLVKINDDLVRRLEMSENTAELAVAGLDENPWFVSRAGDTEHIWLRREARYEEEIAASIIARLNSPSDKRTRPPREITLFPGLDGEIVVALSDEQRAATRICLENRFSCLTGPPGAGKTATLRAILMSSARAVICAVAAAAVRRAEQVTGCNRAMTIWMLTHDPVTWKRCPQPDLLRGVDTLIIEEASMVSLWEMATLLKAADMAGVARVIECGDDKQLPPIGSGEPFANIVRSGVTPMGVLTTVFRNKSGSGVQRVTAAIRAGAFTGSTEDLQKFGSDGVEFISCDGDFADAVSRKRGELAAEYGETETVALSPFNKDSFGIHALNRRSREMDGIPDGAPRVGEILMCVENHWLKNRTSGGSEERLPDYHLLNGTRLIVADVDPDFIVAHPLGDARERLRLSIRPHAHGPATRIVWGRFATVHKFQGSEARAVLAIIPPGALKMIEGEAFLFDLANFYTAVSRAKERVVVMGALGQLPALVEFGSRRRITFLEYLLRDAVPEEFAS
jgi:hypothetical protein